MESLYIQIFLLLDIFVMGILAAIAVRHFRAHRQPELRAADSPAAPSAPPVAPVELPARVKENLVHEAETNFLAVLNSSVGELQHGLRDTAGHLNQQLAKLGTEVTDGEKERYAAMLQELREQTQAALSTAQAEIAEHQAEIRQRLNDEEAAVKAKLAEEQAAEQKRLMELIDTKLSDAVASFLTETLQHNVDLGAQAAYLKSMLDEHKDEIKREVAPDEAPAAQ